MESEDHDKDSDKETDLPTNATRQHHPLPLQTTTTQPQPPPNNSMAKRIQHHVTLIKRRWLILFMGFLLLVFVAILRTNESAHLGFIDSQDYKIIKEKSLENNGGVAPAPPVPSSSSWSWSSSGKTQLFPSSSTEGTDTTKTGDELVIKTRYSVPLHAAEALQCRDSVVSFVINATDGKDECVGLQKAFDQTCGVGAAVVDSSTQRHLQRRHKKRWAQDSLSWAYVSKKWRIWLYRTTRWTFRKLGWLGNFVTTGETDDSNPLFFAEDEVLQAWSEGEYLVENDLDRDVYMDIMQKWERQGTWSTHRFLQETDNSTTSDVNRTTHFNMKLPTAKKHATEDLVDQTLSLHQGDQAAEPSSNGTSQVTEGKTTNQKSRIPKSTESIAIYDATELRKCCASILNVYHENCSTDEEETISDSRLFFVVCVMAACGTVKSLIRYYRVLWLPEAAGCILVGVASGYIVMFFPHHDLSFDGHWFLRIMVPPIIFEAALSIDKKSFDRHVIPILFYAVGGTLMATFLTAFIVHQGSFMLRSWCAPMPYVEALTFGALISSIDPIAVLSVLSNMGMTDMDTIYVLIFGESLLNDGVAIVLFDTLVRFLDESIIIDGDAIANAVMHFTVVASGSLLVGVGAGMLGTVYFWIFRGCQTPLVEVLMFFCWALLPYYICDGIEWSGIVCAVATGFVMDIHIVGQRSEEAALADSSERSNEAATERGKPFASRRERRQIFNSPNGQLSEESRTHIGFVAEIISTTMETAIFAYLGLFLFSHRYHWNVWHTLIAIFACGASRALMIPTMSFFANWTSKFVLATESFVMPGGGTLQNNNSGSPAPGHAAVVVDKKMQLVLWFAGLRGAMSFALVEHVPLYDSSNGEGTRLKPEMKAMTSASILFTVFVLGGYTYYVMEHLGLSPNNSRRTSDVMELALLPNISTPSNSRRVDKSTSGTNASSPSHARTPLKVGMQYASDDEDDRSLTQRTRRRPPTSNVPRQRSPSRTELP